MAIYSLNVASIGKTTHAAGTAGAHLRYIARPDACSHLDAENVPVDDIGDAPAWIDRQEALDRKNARVIDKIRIALPRELDEQQRAELLRSFCQDITGGRVPWYAGIHQSGEDAHNPHAHIVVRDRDIETGKRVLKWSDSPRDRAKEGLVPNAVEHIRERWETLANDALARAGHDARIDRRTLEAQGIDREPTIHVGPRAQHIDSAVKRPESQVRPQRKRRLRNSGYENCETTDYPMIDGGRTRNERNAEIIDLNLERAARSPDFETRTWAQFEKAQVREDRQLAEWIAVRARRRTLEQRRIRAEFHAKDLEVRAAAKAEKLAALDSVRNGYQPRIAALRMKQADERQAQKKDHGRLLKRAWAFVSPKARNRRDDERRALIDQHSQERSALLSEYRQARTIQTDAVKARYQPMQDELRQQRRKCHSEATDRFDEQIREEDNRLQSREAERETGRRTLNMRLRQLKDRQQKGRTVQRGGDQGFEL